MNFQVSEEKVADHNVFLFGGFVEFQSHQNSRFYEQNPFVGKEEGRKEGERERWKKKKKCGQLNKMFTIAVN